MMSLFAGGTDAGELRLLGDDIAKTEMPDPVFILGHWRSGTTLLHGLMAQDDQFAYPRIYQVSNPHSFLQPADRTSSGSPATGGPGREDGPWTMWSST